MEEELANELNLKGTPEEMKVSWFDDSIVSQRTLVVSCDIQGLYENSKSMKLNDIRTFKELKLPRQTVNLTELTTKCPQLIGLPIKSYKDAKPRILIGLDNGKTFLIKTSVDCTPHGLIASKTPLGWIVYGENSHCVKNISNHNFHLKRCLQADLEQRQLEIDEMIRNYYDTDKFGVELSQQNLQSKDTLRALNILNKTTVFKCSFYETGLLWKCDDVQLPDSYNMAMKRFENLERKMKKDPCYGARYEKAMNEFIAKDYARILSDEEAYSVTPTTWYLPHFGVTTVAKPDKLRLVFDAAATVNGVSLNSKLLKGPDLNKPLVAVLSQFRELPIAVCADIREMFCQIKICQEDRDSQRFIWKNSKGEKKIFEMQSMVFGAACSPTAAQFVKNQHAEKYRYKYPLIANAIQNNFNVDDFVMSFSDEALAIAVSHGVREVLKEAGFDLRGFLSNSNDVTQMINGPYEEQDGLLNMNVENGLTVDKILGMYWQSKTDHFVFQLKFHKVPQQVLAQKRPPTKREILSLMMSIFDPFGYLADYHITTKLLVQMTWNRNLGWDEPLPEDLSSWWYKWQSQLPSVKDVRIPRCYTKIQPRQVQLHTFVDASEQAFAAACYFRIETSQGVSVVFVFGKTRVAPRKQLSIPRMELQAAVLGTRLCNTVLTSHIMKPSSCHYWSDSKTVINWVNSESRNYKPFVAHRISEILDSSRPSDWKWVPTTQNVADDATRLKFDQARSESRWLKGPEFLYRSMEDWPLQPFDLKNYESEVELKNDNVNFSIKQAKTVIDFSRFSKYLRLIRSMAWLQRFMFNALSKKRKLTRKSGEITVEEYRRAELVILRLVQEESYSRDRKLLCDGVDVNKDSELFKLNPYIHDNGLIRMKGRIDAAVIVPLDTRRPIIMPRHHTVTRLLIKWYHENCIHQNDETVIALLRQKFYIPSIRQQLRTVKSKCSFCKIQNAKPSQPMMGSLPVDRLSITYPFTYTGVDYFGPVTIVIGRRHEKRWVALFTCLSTRAIHMEIATDLSTDAFILCLRNFVNLRGVPKRMRSDNGTNFVGLDKELHSVPEFFDMNKIQLEMTRFGIEWRFNTPTDASAGGSWERLVQTVKRSMRNVFENRSIREDTFRNVLIEIANIVNNHPLTYIPVSYEEEEPLTPNHFLLGRLNSTQSPGPVEERMMCLRKQWRISQQLKNHFQKRWIMEYLPELTRRSKWHKETPPLKVNDLVLICDPDVPRSQWLRGRVQEVNPTKDGQVRSALVKTSTGLLRRPANKLAVLDLIGESPRSIHGGEDVVKTSSG